MAVREGMKNSGNRRSVAAVDNHMGHWGQMKDNLPARAGRQTVPTVFVSEKVVRVNLTHKSP